jgi:hypothetical protein
MNTNKTTLGAQALRVHLMSNDMSVAAFAVAAGLSERSIHHWLSGAGAPRVKAAVAIEDATSGAVPVRLWVREVRA